MTDKFGRNYRLTIDPNDGRPPIVITMPFTVRFSIERNTLSDLNSFNFDIYNLSADNRKRLFQDRFDLDTARTLVFEAGYSNLFRIAQGRIYQMSSARDGGSPDIITRIEAKDGSFYINNSQVFQTVNVPTVGGIIQFLCGQLLQDSASLLSIGAIGTWPQVLSRPAVLNGLTWNILREYSANKVYIDNGKIYALQDFEATNAQIQLISDATGLLDTPRRDQGFLSVTSLLEPGVDMSALVNLQSTINPIYNGTYKVIGIKHQGVISQAVNGPCRSIFSLLAPNRFKQFTQVSTQ